MAAADGYRPIDEPLPSGLAHLTVNPIWPLFAVMFGGPWISWPWFVLNAFAFGSPGRFRDAALAVGGFVATVVLVVGMLALGALQVVPEGAIPYLFVLVTAFKLGVSYVLYARQAHPFAIHEHFGGPVRSGILGVVAGMVGRGVLEGSLPGLLLLVLA